MGKEKGKVLFDNEKQSNFQSLGEDVRERESICKGEIRLDKAVLGEKEEWNEILNTSLGRFVEVKY